MSWTYAGLKAAIAALSPMPSTPDAIVDSINAQTATAVVPFTWAAVKMVAQRSGNWSKVVLRARLSDGSAANLAAINAYETPEDRLFDPPVRVEQQKLQWRSGIPVVGLHTLERVQRGEVRVDQHEVDS